MEIDADNTTLLIQWYKGNRNEEELQRYAELLGFEHEDKFFYSTRQNRPSGILSEADYQARIEEFNRRRNHNKTKDIVLINYVHDNDTPTQNKSRTFFQSAYHETPHRFDKFTSEVRRI